MLHARCKLQRKKKANSKYQTPSSHPKNPLHTKNTHPKSPPPTPPSPPTPPRPSLFPSFHPLSPPLLLQLLPLSRSAVSLGCISLAPSSLCRRWPILPVRPPSPAYSSGPRSCDRDLNIHCAPPRAP